MFGASVFVHCLNVQFHHVSRWDTSKYLQHVVTLLHYHSCGASLDGEDVHASPPWPCPIPAICRYPRYSARGSAAEERSKGKTESKLRRICDGRVSWDFRKMVGFRYVTGSEHGFLEGISVARTLHWCNSYACDVLWCFFWKLVQAGGKGYNIRIICRKQEVSTFNTCNLLHIFKQPQRLNLWCHSHLSVSIEVAAKQTSDSCSH